MKKYMVVLHGAPSKWAEFSDAKQEEIIKRYIAWVAKLNDEKRFQGGSELTRNYRNLHAQGHQIVVDGPFPETKEVLTGYFIITAKNLEEAAEVSKACPALSHGDWVQVYEMPERE